MSSSEEHVHCIHLCRPSRRTTFSGAKFILHALSVGEAVTHVDVGSVGSIGLGFVEKMYGSLLVED